MTLHQPVLHLASASPRRRDILTAMGVRFSHAGVDIDETPAPGEAVAEMVQRVALNDENPRTVLGNTARKIEAIMKN